MKCPEGYYTPSAGQTKCQKCPTGYISTGSFCSIGRYLLIGPGGPGGASGYAGGGGEGGGGGGGFLDDFFDASFVLGDVLVAHVGVSSRDNVAMNYSSLGDIVAYGGGKGGYYASGADGASGGGGYYYGNYPGE